MTDGTGMIGQFFLADDNAPRTKRSGVRLLLETDDLTAPNKFLDFLAAKGRVSPSRGAFPPSMYLRSIARDPRPSDAQSNHTAGVEGSRTINALSERAIRQNAWPSQE